MSVFVDTSALLAVLDVGDDFHIRARDEWGALLDGETELVTSNYVLLETAALVQGRIGMDAMRALAHDVYPALTIEWIDRDLHQLASTALITANRRQLSLVDMTSFTVMRQHDIDTAFTFDDHFAEQGFTVVPGR